MSRRRDMRRRNKRLAEYERMYGWIRVKGANGWVAITFPTKVV